MPLKRSALGLPYMNEIDSRTLSRRTLLHMGLGVAALLGQPRQASAAPVAFDHWREAFRAKALARGISEAIYTRVMGRIEPDTSVFVQMRNQPEFNEQTWQYINR